VPTAVAGERCRQEGALAGGRPLKADRKETGPAGRCSEEERPVASVAGRRQGRPGCSEEERSAAGSRAQIR